MSPRPSSPRLAGLDPEAVAAFVCRGLIEHEARLRQLTSRGGQALDDDVRGFPFYADILRLVSFAQRGHQAHPGEAVAIIRSLSHFYFGSAAWGSAEPLGDQSSRGREACEIALVVLASRARLAIAAGRPVDHRGLAALGGVHSSRIHALCGGKKAVLKRSGVGRTGEITPASALAWLQAQGVYGATS